ncbi:MAG: GIY-YIG nuclease family protein [Microbacterium aurum]|uniref:GIY-YIG nuclease family protein n=1 Tax=Microbacterium aurum TaxID=36805 RepID=UPI00248E685B|nr:GIY-YIG nuclease family protein [Microbacterium aurum]
MYILECSDGSYYVGSCRNLDQRLWLHDLGEGAEYTKRRRPLKLVYCEEFSNVGDAFAREKQVQGWGRAKRTALIDGRYGDLPALSRKAFGATGIKGRGGFDTPLVPRGYSTTGGPLVPHGYSAAGVGGGVSRETLWFRYAARSSRLRNHRGKLVPRGYATTRGEVSGGWRGGRGWALR